MNSTKHNDLIYDVGLHKGEDSEFYLKKGFRVIAFEADQELVRLASERLAAYIENGNLIIVEGAIVDESILNSGARTVPFYRSDASVCGSLHERWVDRNAASGIGAHATDVEVIDFARCMQKYGVPYYLKIDIEGSDLFCLQALLKLDIRPSYVSIETEHSDVSRLEEEFRILEELGYTRFKAAQQSGMSKLKAPFPAKEGNYVDHDFSDAASGLFGRELPGEWTSKSHMLEEMKKFIRRFRICGMLTARRNWVGRKIYGIIRRLVRKPLPGWFDTHAMHSSVVETDT